jgi:TPR repeat protein
MDDKKLEYLDKLKKKADEGDTKALHDYANEIVDEEPSVAFRYMKMAADSLDPQAINDLAVYYIEGVGCIRDEDMAFSLFKKAADLGDPNAQRNYALSIENNDPKLAYKYMIMSANQKNRDAMNDLGIYYKEGRGTNKNLDKALEWFKKAADMADDNGCRNYANLIVNKNPSEAVKYMTFSANKGNQDALYDLAQFYKYGIGVDKNNDKYLENLKNAAYAGNKIAMKEYALNCTEQNPKDAFLFMQECAFDGDKEAMVYLADFYYQGTGSNENREAAKEWYKEAADLGDKYAQRCYAELIKDEDKEEAYSYMKEASDNGDEEALKLLPDYKL